MVYDLATRLKTLRQEKHLRQVQLAALIGVEKSTVSNYENGVREPSNRILVRLANIYGVTTDFLLGRSDDRLLDLSGLTADEAAMITQLVQTMTEKNKRLERFL